MRKLLIGLVVVLLILFALPAAFLLIPNPAQKWAVERAATLATGRQVTLGEPFRLSVWPPLTVTAADVRVANADWGKAPELLRIDALDAGVDVLAYLNDGLVKVDRLLVRKPVVNLEVAEDGRRNWRFGDGKPETAEQPSAGSEPAKLPGFVLGDIRLEDGLLAYDDRAKGQARRIEDIDLAVAQTGADQPLSLDGGLAMDGKRATLTGAFAKANALAAGEASPAQLALGLPGGKVTFDGTLQSAGPAVAGRTAIDLTAPRELLAWLGQTPALPDGALRTASLETKLDLTAQRVALDELKLRVDDIQGQGRLATTLGEPPKVEGELAFNRLALDPYLPPEQATAVPAAPPPGRDEGWSTEPIELPLPLPVDLDVRVRAEGLRARQLEAGPLAVHAQSDRQQTTATLEELQLYEGRVTGSAVARPGERPAFTVGVRGDGVRLLPALRGLAGQERLDGTAALALDLTAAGKSQRDLVASANGQGNVALRDGAILGINIAGMIRQVMTVGLSGTAGEQQRTDFAEAGGSFRVENGIVRNDDLHLRAPVLRLEGAGTVDLPQRTIDYRIRPQLAATLQGQGATGESNLQAGVPFLVQGPLTAPAIRFDLDGLLTGAIRSPADIGRVAADLARDPKAAAVLKDRFDVLGRLPDAGGARKALQGILGGGGGGRQPANPAAGAASGLKDQARDLLKGLGR